MRIVTPLLAQAQQQDGANTNKRVPSAGAPAPEMRRAKSGDHLRRPRSHTSTQPGSTPTDQARQRSRPPSQIIGEKAVAKHRSTVSANAASPAPGTDAWRAEAEQKFTQEMFEREKSMELIRREKSMDVRLESRLLMDREYRHSMGKPESHQQQPQRVRSEKSSPRTTPPQSLARNNSGERASNRNTTNNNSSRDSSFIADPSVLNSSNVSSSSASSRVMMPHSVSNNSNFSQQQQQQRHPHEELRRGGSVAAAREGMSYRQVFGLSSSDYLFNVTPPNYTRHRRFSDSDTESLHNFNFIHKVISQPSGSPSATTNTNSSSSQSTQQLSGTGAMFNSQTPTPSAAPLIAGAALGGKDASKSKRQTNNWMKKVRRKSEDNPKRKVVAQLSNK